jgi:hypothetical protein
VGFDVIREAMMIRNQMSLIGKKLAKAAEREFEPTQLTLLPGAVDEAIFCDSNKLPKIFL